MSWLERELAWGIPATELRHLVGRIGELYAALVTNGQLATNTNQKGYDVISQDGERISVKTTGMQGHNGHVAFNANTLELVDRIIVLMMNTEEMQIETLFDGTCDEARKLMAGPDAYQKLTISLSKFRASRKIVPIEQQEVVEEASFEDHTISALESGTVVVRYHGKLVSPSMPHLIKIAARLGVDVLNGQGNPRNTRQLGSLIIRHLQAS